MADLTVFAEALISTAARAFYDDEVVCLIDVLIRDNFLPIASQKVASNLAIFDK